MKTFLRNAWGIAQITFTMIGFYLLFTILAAIFGGGGSKK
jgi:hypothetical protein